LLGEHNEEILIELLDYSPEAVQELRDQGTI
jgi:crotonobetainyl-CoA:carnitine CoA-transferase CaiB-like acyl-CoA transferase